jgi:hypothetical protein
MDPKIPAEATDTKPKTTEQIVRENEELRGQVASIKSRSADSPREIQIRKRMALGRITRWTAESATDHQIEEDARQRETRIAKLVRDGNISTMEATAKVDAQMAKENEKRAYSQAVI